MKIDFDETTTPALARISRAMNPQGRAALWKNVAGGLEIVTRTHIRRLEGTRHATARALGATPTGRMSQAINAVSSEATGTGCTVGVADPIFSRAGKDITIKPRRGKALAIPIHKLAYGKNPRELTARGIKLFKLGKKRETGFLAGVKRFFGLGRGSSDGTGILAMKDPDGEGIIPLYALKRSVFQRQDRTLLPSDGAYADAADDAAREFLAALQQG